MPAEFAPLFSQESQFQAKSGRNNTGGWLRVFLAGTDDPAETYSDYSGTRNPERIVLDDNGRAVVICDSARAYRLEVYSADGALLWTEEPVYCSGSAGGGVAVTRIMSSDGSIAVDTDTAGSITTYDLSIAPSDSPEFIEWARCANPSITATGVAFPAYVGGSMEVEAGAGLKVQDGLFYHVTSTFNVTPTGAGINYETLTVRLMVSAGGVTRAVASRSFDIDNSLSDPVNVEFSCDVVPAGDGYLFWYVVNPGAFAAVDAEMQVHRVYSGINAVPGTCATKQWVQDVFDADMSTKVDWSAIGYNQYGEINSIGSSAIAGGLDSATVSGIASAYAESAASSKADMSSLTAYQPVSGMTAYQSAGDYAYNSAVSSKLEESAFTGYSAGIAGELSGISGELSGKADGSALTAYQEVSGMTAYALSSDVDSGLSGKLDATASSQFITALPDDLATTGDIEAAVSGKLDSSASSTWYPMDGNPSGFLTSHQSLAGYATEAYVDSSVSGKADSSALTAYQPTGDYAYNSAVSSKLDASASSEFYGTGNISGFVDSAYVDSAVSGKQDTLTFDWDADSAISSINGSALAGGGEVFPVEIVTGSSLRAVITTGFQGDNATRPALFISSNPEMYNSYPRMMLSENYSQKSATFLADAFEFYAAGTKRWRADYGGISAANQYALNSGNVSGKQWMVQSGVVSGGDTGIPAKWWLNRNGVSGITGTATWQYTTAEYTQLTSMYDTVSANSASWAASGIQETALGWLEV